MPAYMVAQYRNLKEYDAYRKAATELNRKCGAKVLTRAGSARCVEGEWPHESLVIIEFASAEAAEAFYKTAEYAEVKALRQDAPPITIVVVDGAV